MQFSEVENLFLYNQLSHYEKLFNFSEYHVGVFVLKNVTTDDNEDSLFFTTNGSTIRFGVADGAGGHPRGKDASFLVIDEIKNLKKISILDQIERANKKVVDLKVGAKTTLAFAHLNEDRVTFHSIGDSEIIYWNAVGRELFSSTPHSPTGLKVKAGITSQAESLSDPDRHIVNSFLGDEFVKINSTSSFELKKGHTIVIGTDGLFDNISHLELGNMVSLGNFEDSFKSLTSYCLEQNPATWLKDDDISFIYLRKVRA